MPRVVQGSQLISAIEEDTDERKVHIGIDQLYCTQSFHSNKRHSRVNPASRDPSREQPDSLEICPDHEEMSVGSRLHHAEHDRALETPYRAVQHRDEDV